MNISSAQVDCLTTSNNTVSIGAVGSDTITLSSGTGSSYYYNTGAGTGGFSSDTITISGGGSGYATSTGILATQIGSISITDISTNQFVWKNPEEFIDCLPDFNRIQKMCEEYPGLKIAFEKFKTVYNLVKDHYDTPEDKRPKP
jgi:hypothetical protein